MKYYQIETIGGDNNDYCFTYEYIMGMEDININKGIPLDEDDYPDDPEQVTLTLDDDHQGLIPADFLGNASSILIVKKRVLDLLKEFNIGKIEKYGFNLINHRGRVHSKDYLVLNPLEIKDYLNKELSKISYRKNGSIRRVKKFALTKDKLKDAPDLFRVPEDTHEYFFSERLVEAIREAGFTNFKFGEVEVG